jgi:hypothetical protein
MKKIVLILLLTIPFVQSCMKTATTTTSSGGTSTTDTTTSTSLPTVKFFNVMDYGDVVVYLNGSSIGNIPIYYPSSYRIAKAGTNSIKVTFGGTTVVDVTADFVLGKNYSIYVYRVGYNWKTSLVSDDLTTPATSYAKIRVLDFRTQAYFDYVKIKFLGLGVGELNYTNRNFLDHQSYSDYSTFKTVGAGTYNITVFNDTANLATKTNFPFVSGKIYSLIMMTNASLTTAEAIYQIKLDLETLK